MAESIIIDDYNRQAPCLVPLMLNDQINQLFHIVISLCGLAQFFHILFDRFVVQHKLNGRLQSLLGEVDQVQPLAQIERLQTAGVVKMITKARNYYHRNAIVDRF